jgi:Domain of unknown function (DUF1992)
MVQEQEQPKRQKTLRQWESAVDKQIREAQERGDFDRLPGQGRPLPQEPWEGDWALAHHVLRQAGETLPWISLGRDIEAAEAKLQRLRERAAQLRSSGLSAADFRVERERARARYLEAAAEVDRLLLEYSFSVPVRHLERGRLPPHIAARQFDAACPAL